MARQFGSGLVTQSELALFSAQRSLTVQCEKERIESVGQCAVENFSELSLLLGRKFKLADQAGNSGLG
jgi:hypothetical protein